MTVSTTPRDALLIDDGQRRLLLLGAVIFFGLAVRGGVLANMLAVVAGVGALTMARIRRRRSRDSFVSSPASWEVVLLTAVVLFGALGVSGWSGPAIGPSSSLLERLPGAIWIVLGVTLYVMRDRVGPRRAVIAVCALTVAFTLVFGVTHLRSAEGVGLDVLFLHQEAAQAMSNGLNPYTDAVAVPNRAPTADPDAEIVGYVYPPVTGVGYSLGQWALGDPRYTSIASWVGVLAILGVWAVRSPMSHLAYLVILLAALPGWPLVLRAAWTEPLSLLLLAVSAAAWRREVRSGVWLGVALASKQYFLVAAPLLLPFGDRNRARRALAAVSVIVLTVGAALLWDAAAFWRAAVEFHATTPPRVDSSNLVGLLGWFGVVWNPPAILPIGVGLAVAALVSRRSRDVTDTFVALALALAASFLVSSQAFANYWLLVMGLCLLGLARLHPVADSYPPNPPRRPRAAPA